jgi:hypothetical protein
MPPFDIALIDITGNIDGRRIQIAEGQTSERIRKQLERRFGPLESTELSVVNGGGALCSDTLLDLLSNFAAATEEGAGPCPGTKLKRMRGFVRSDKAVLVPAGPAGLEEPLAVVTVVLVYKTAQPMLEAGALAMQQQQQQQQQRPEELTAVQGAIAPPTDPPLGTKQKRNRPKIDKALGLPWGSYGISLVHQFLPRSSDGLFIQITTVEKSKKADLEALLSAVVKIVGSGESAMSLHVTPSKLWQHLVDHLSSFNSLVHRMRSYHNYAKYKEGEPRGWAGVAIPTNLRKVIQGLSFPLLLSFYISFSMLLLQPLRGSTPHTHTARKTRPCSTATPCPSAPPSQRGWLLSPLSRTPRRLPRSELAAGWMGMRTRDGTHRRRLHGVATPEPFPAA